MRADGAGQNVVHKDSYLLIKVCNRSKQAVQKELIFMVAIDFFIHCLNHIRKRTLSKMIFRLIYSSEICVGLWPWKSESTKEYVTDHL